MPRDGHRTWRMRSITARSDPVKSGVFSSKIVGDVAKCTMNQRAGACEVGEVAADGERLVGSRVWLRLGIEVGIMAQLEGLGMAIHRAFALFFKCNET